jgi:hypothetical protein
MTHKKLLSLFCITFSLYSYSTPTNTPKDNDYYIKQQFVQSVKQHPKKTAVGAPLLAYGLKLVYEGSKTRGIKPDRGVYDLLGFGTEIFGGALITVGTALLYQVVRDAIFPKNSDAKKTDNPEDAKQK